MAQFCLTKQFVEKFLDGLRSGEIDPFKMGEMTSARRRIYLENFVGKDNAQSVNALFESKLLLKNQKAGFATWAKKVANISPKARRDLVSRIEKMDRILNPKEEDQFLNDLASQRLGVDITIEEAKTIAGLSKEISEAREIGKISEMEKLSPLDAAEWMKNPSNRENARIWGRKVIELDNYITDLKQQALKLTMDDIKKNPIGAGVKTAQTALDTSKAMNASMDASALFNQGFAILTNYKTVGIWKRNGIDMFSNMVRTFGGKAVWDEFRADLISRPNYINGAYKEHGVALGVTEEAYPTNLPEKVNKIPIIKDIPIVNLPFEFFSRAFKASEVGFNIFQYKNRADVADLMLALAEKQGEIVRGDNRIKGLGTFINSLTGRGSLGKLEPVGNVINAPFFSLRRQVALVDSLTGYQMGEKSSFVRKQGAYATLQQILFIGIVIAIAKAFLGDKVDLDSTSADFGKIRVGDTRIDVTGGRASYVVLASRIIQGKTTSSTSGKVTLLNQGGFNDKTYFSILEDFGLNKLSPALGAALQIAKGKDRNGNKPTALGLLIGMYTPLGIQNLDTVLNNPNSAPWLLTSALDGSGILTNTYPNANIKTKAIPEGAKIKNDSFINAVIVYSNALKTDPETAFNRIFSGQKILKTENGAIIVERMSVGDSQAYKKKYGANTKQVKLDHTIPLELGGSNDASNLKLVSTSDWSSYTRVENALGSALKRGKISKTEAQDEIIRFKRITDAKKRKDFGNNLISKYK